MEIATALQAGGDIATIAVIYLLWRFDRRVIVIEQSIKHLVRGEKRDEKEI